MSFESHMDFTKKMPSTLSFIAFIMFDDSSGMKKVHLLGLLLKYEKGERIDSRTVRIGTHRYKFCHFEPTCISLGLTLSLTNDKHLF